MKFLRLLGSEDDNRQTISGADCAVLHEFYTYFTKRRQEARWTIRIPWTFGEEQNMKKERSSGAIAWWKEAYTWKSRYFRVGKTCKANSAPTTECRRKYC